MTEEEKKSEFKLHEAFKEPGAEDYKKKGNEAFKEQKWDEAIKNYNKAIQLDPNQAVFYSNRAACWSSKGNHDSALADAKRCIERDPKYIKGYTRKAKALFDLKNVDEAEAAYQEGLAVDPTNEACSSGIADIRASRKKNRKSGSGMFNQASGMMKGFVDKMKTGGLGGRMQMYVVMMVGYYAFTTYTGRNSRDRSSTGPSPAPDVAADDDDDMPNAPPMKFRRGFAEVDNSWLSYVEADGRADTVLLLLHRTSLSAEAEFGASLPQFLKKVSPPGGVRLLAPDRPCHGYSPCPQDGKPNAGTGWLKGLLAGRPSPKHLAIVACGREASLQALTLVQQRKQKSQLLLVNPQLLSPPAGAMATSADVRAWLEEHYSTGSAQAAADAAAWATKGVGPAEQSKDNQSFDKVAKLPEGSAVTMLYDDGEEELKDLTAALEDEGIEVRVRHASGPATMDEVLTEAQQLVGTGDFAPQDDDE